MRWAQSRFKRIEFVKQKAAIAKVHISSAFVKEIGFTFYQSIKRIVNTFGISHNLIISLDQPPLPYSLFNQYAMVKKDLNKFSLVHNRCSPPLINFSKTFPPRAFLFQPSPPGF